ncbi:hypothetical protein Kpol_478p1 [Vanderwaltozyma polyspora DSM 70294]|uniref:GPI ethanolamine phosphate transferase 3 n=1 Tax=Vanderwaltozyma polyspora (strain ATCC 22028 / DSM 70294 / BCRC 21397 / CBS 2163 / NBRC 10782 / NRRL Y-8283 / UCD 57-17) TaxID=436907 RepID=A7TPM1_VANPO|nr:uncharacterized protein Kpol_478p1 [Vanderwaltozyma polyspora DSM 70294]EDO15766.1 hypothetical protein Kpol_478p1 [Vanderwaltozyma polyspora DSM 70294]
MNGLEDEKFLYKLRFQKFSESHTLYVLFLSLIAILQFISIAFFCKGFLLTRNVLDNVNNLNPSDLNQDYTKKFDKAVILIIDALRFDFVIPVNSTDPLHNQNYHNNIITLYDQFISQNNNKDHSSILLKFIADPPTTTLQRLKGLTTGSLPTFIDAGTNFDGSVIEEDNLIKQLYLKNEEIYFVGDDTWDSLFNPFLSNHSKPFESLNVWDLDTVDNGVISYFNDHLINQKTNDKKWDILIGHMLGVDHVGHKYGPNHFTMREKQLQVNNFINDIIESIDDDTLLVIMGDHGMDHTGNHGGDSKDELESTLFMYSKKTDVWELGDPNNYNIENSGDNYRSVNQIDLVPTLSLLLDVPIPFNNLGWPINEISKNQNERNIFEQLTLKQLKNYQEVSGLVVNNTEKYFHLEQLYQDSLIDSSKATIFQNDLLELCKDLWARFDYISITTGIIFLTFSLIILILTTKLIPSIVVSQLVPSFVPLIFIMILVSNLCIHSLNYVFQYSFFYDDFWWSLFATALGIVIGCFVPILDRYTIKWLIFRFFGELSDYWSRVGAFFLILHALLFTSNSFTIWEDKIVGYFVISIAILTLYEFTFVPKRQSTSALLTGVVNEDESEEDANNIQLIKESDSLPLSKGSRLLGVYYSIVLIVCTRLASTITICREEQGDYCIPTFTTKNNYSQLTLCVSLVLMLLTPSSIKGYYKLTSSFQGAAPIWISYFLRFFLLMNAGYWGLTTIENMLENPELDLLFVKLTLARTLLGFSLIALNVGWFMGPLCIDVQIDQKIDSSENQATIMGYNNIYGSQYFLFILNLFMCIMIFNKPMAQISLYLMLNQILAVIEIIDLFKLKENIIGPFTLSLISYQQFFSTGHEATIPSVQWDVGFIITDRITFPFTHIGIFLNTFGPHILVSLSVGLLTLWRQSPAILKPQTLLGRIVSNGGCLLIYNTVLCLSSFVWVTHFRRHLMVWKIFCPRFLFACLSLISTQLFVTLITIAFASGTLIRQINKLFWA